MLYNIYLSNFGFRERERERERETQDNTSLSILPICPVIPMSLINFLVIYIYLPKFLYTYTRKQEYFSFLPFVNMKYSILFPKMFYFNLKCLEERSLKIHMYILNAWLLRDTTLWVCFFFTTFCPDQVIFQEANIDLTEEQFGFAVL